MAAQDKSSLKTQVFNLEEMVEPQRKKVGRTWELFKKLVPLVENRQGLLVEFTSISTGAHTVKRLAEYAAEGYDGQTFDVYSQIYPETVNRYIWLRPEGEKQP